MITKVELDQILGLLTRVGFNLYHPVLDDLIIKTALAEFQEHLGGNLCITLLSEIGKGIEVDHIDLLMMEIALERLIDYSKKESLTTFELTGSN